MIIKLGTRKSKLALAQANIVKDLIESSLDYEVKLELRTSLGDQDRKSRLTRFRGKGAFTSHLEEELALGNIDIAVHSLNDLPVEIDDEFEIIAYIKRHNPSDSIIIDKSKILDEENLVFEKNLRFATGSPRRQAQFLDLQPDAIPIDIRGNVDTRISYVDTELLDAVILASSSFYREEFELPRGVKRIELPLHQFPCAPGQAVIAVQVRKGELKELKKLNHAETEKAVRYERNMLEQMGGGCELSLGTYISKKNGEWNLDATVAQPDWTPAKTLAMKRIRLSSKNGEKLIDQAMEYFPKRQSQPDEIDPLLTGKSCIVIRDHAKAAPYTQLLRKHGAKVAVVPILEFETKYNMLNNNDLLDSWVNSEWVVISSQRAVEFLNALHSSNPKSKRIAAVGKKTADEIRSIGLPVHLVAEGSMKSLKRILKEALKIFPGDVLYLRGENFTEEPTEDSKSFPVYKAKIRKFDFPFNPDYVVVFSSRSFESLISQIEVNSDTEWIAIGNRTGSTIKSKGYRCNIADTPDPSGIFKAMTN